jgi:hypothetical protein
MTRYGGKYLLLGLIGLMMVIVLYRDRILLDPQASIWEHYRSFKWWLLPQALSSLAPPSRTGLRLRSGCCRSAWRVD